ncbi:hypothetical protein FSP39_007085 [Pinctada imbricata]|uniref:Uncharacterized protein n=1 Tax=Pinctada imbricata TaxID=66713 RepID=A0AA89CCJ7_PINIB|nr:hypothetical protein FSP39_007085 [Pinctada imbricata]
MSKRKQPEHISQLQKSNRRRLHSTSLPDLSSTSIMSDINKSDSDTALDHPQGQSTPQVPQGNPSSQPLSTNSLPLITNVPPPPLYPPSAPGVPYFAAMPPSLVQVLGPYMEAMIQAAVKPLQDKIAKQEQVIQQQKDLIDDLYYITDDLYRRVDDADSKVENLEQYGRRNSLRFHNVKLPSEDCNTDKVIVDLCKEQLDITISEDDICRSHPIGEPNRHGKSQLIARFRNWKIKNNIFLNKKKLKGSSDKVFITEDLTPYRQSLMKYISAAKRDKRLSSFWTSDGRIFVKLSEGGRRHLLVNEEQLNGILSP